MKPTLTLLTALLLTPLTSLQAADSPKPVAKPNILFILAAVLLALVSPAGHAVEIVSTEQQLAEQIVAAKDRPAEIEVRSWINLNRSVELPATLDLTVRTGGGFDLADGAVFSLQGHLDARPRPVFRGKGRVLTLGRTEAVLPEWFHRGSTEDEMADWQPAIQAAVDVAAQGARRVRLAARRYRVARPVSLSSTVGKDVKNNLRFEGANRSSQARRGTLLVGDTGPNQPVLEAVDTDGLTTENIGLIAGTQHPSTIGLLQARGRIRGWGGDHRHRQLFVDMGSDLAANGGLGTLGVVNLDGEETVWEDLQVWANLPLAISIDRTLRVTRHGLDGERRLCPSGKRRQQARQHGQQHRLHPGRSLAAHRLR